MQQSNLEAVHIEINGAVREWANGLITDFELFNFMARMKEQFIIAGGLPAAQGLICPNTGLRYK